MRVKVLRDKIQADNQKLQFSTILNLKPNWNELESKIRVIEHYYIRSI